MEKLAKNLANQIGESQSLDKERIAVIAYGLTAIIQMAGILLTSLLIALFTGKIIESIIIFIAVGLIRKSTGGIHSKSIYGCLFVSVGSITLLSLISGYIVNLNLNFQSNIFASSIIIILCGFLFYKKVPMDSPNKPIVKPEKIKRLRKQSFGIIIFIIISSVIGAAFADKISLIYKISLSLQLALLWQTFTLTKPCAVFIGAVDHIFCKTMQ